MYARVGGRSGKVVVKAAHVMACSHKSSCDWNEEAKKGFQTYQAQARVETLLEDRVCGVEDEFGEEELVASFVHLFCCKQRCGQRKRTRAQEAVRSCFGGQD